MKRISLLMGIAVIVIAASCNNQSSDNNKSKEMKHDDMKMDNMKMDSAGSNNHKMINSKAK